MISGMAPRLIWCGATPKYGRHGQESTLEPYLWVLYNEVSVFSETRMKIYGGMSLNKVNVVYEIVHRV